MKKILVIEDEAPVRANIVELLTEENFNVISVENGFVGALWAQEHLPDLIICDVMMPEVDGYEVLSALREESMTATIPFIFLTAKADKTDIRQGMQLGADDYLTKPFTRGELLQAIATRFNKQQAIMQQYNAEHQRAEALQQKIRELENYVDDKEQLLQQFQQRLRSTLPKLSIALHMLKNLESGASRDRCLAVMQTVCAEEIALLKQVHNLEFLSPTDFTLLHQLNLDINRV